MKFGGCRHSDHSGLWTNIKKTADSKCTGGHLGKVFFPLRMGQKRVVCFSFFFSLDCYIWIWCQKQLPVTVKTNTKGEKNKEM